MASFLLFAPWSARFQPGVHESEQSDVSATLEFDLEAQQDNAVPRLRKADECLHAWPAKFQMRMLKA